MTNAGDCRSEAAAVVGPVEECLALARPAVEIAGFAIPFNLPYMATHGAPTPDLAPVFVDAAVQTTGIHEPERELAFLDFVAAVRQSAERSQPVSL